MQRARPFLRDLGVGVAALVLHFAIDAIESWSHVRSALKRIKADPVAEDELLGAVVRYVGGTFFAYLLIGVGVGVLLHGWVRLVRPARPLRFAMVSVVVGGLLANLRQMIVQPGLHDWFRYRPQVASNVPPEVLTVLAVALFAAGAVVGWRRRASTRAYAGALLPIGAVAVGLAALWRVPPADVPVPNAGPNVIVLGYDAMRPDHIGFYGAERKITPNIDRFLEESAVWTNAYTPLARTAPSWMTILTGTFPYTHDIRDPLPDPTRLVPKVPMLPQALSARGWHTTFTTDDSRFSYMVPEHGFQTIEQPPVGPANFAISGTEPRFRAFYGILDNPLGWAFVPVVRMNQAFGRSYRPDRFNRSNAQLLADASRNDHFFFASHDCSLHAPADRFHPYTLLFDQKDYKGRNRFRYLSVGSTSASDVEGESVEERAAAQNLNLYDAGLVLVDEAFGKLRAQLEAGGLWENSVVVLLSDHGEDFWEEDQRYRYVGPNHGFHAWGQGQHHVVLAIHWPESLRATRPHGRFDHLASLADLTPTLAEALELPWDGDGRSLYDASPRALYTETGLSERIYWAKYLQGHRTYPFSSSSASYKVDEETNRVHARPEYRAAVIRTKDRFVMDERWKLAVYAMADGWRIDLFDWRADPLNDTDVDDENREVVERLWPQLRARIVADGIEAPEAPPWDPPQRPVVRVVHKEEDDG